ncbi:CapA family protein [Sporosarcina luteola]|uniref:CapA family protein n=1 Tax=Sporosarcina luteola TaxID=582850 RepID=UPI00203A739A|nr:CapA family protein [Sporosarcina luteola]MCM3709105.1 CapA family protein [Sporosarcina luteola]
MGEMIFTATGDTFITRRLPGKDKSFLELSGLLKKADVRFTNLEITVHDGEGIPGAVSGGTWAKTKPAALQDIKDYGFNLVGWVNNHTLDYSIEGLKATERNLDTYEFVHGGAGLNLASASEPRYLETEAGRVAMIAATSTFHESWVAGDQRPDMIGRPGINPLRYQTIYHVTQEQLAHLKKIASSTKINAVRDMSIKEGFKVERKDGLFEFGGHLFKEEKQEGKTTSPIPNDMNRILQAIREAKRQANYVLVSIHAHEMLADDKEQPAQFLETFARACIDEGAHAVVGHGPHLVRGIEVYKNRPIFYSLGNFIFQNDTVTHLPADFYQAYDLSHTNTVADALDVRSKDNSIGLGVNPKIWESVLPIWKMENGELTELNLHPLELGFGKKRFERGWPVLSDNTAVLERLSELSAPYGTEIHIEEGVGKVLLKKGVYV